MWKVELSSQKDGKRSQYRQYSYDNMIKAYNAVKNDKKSVRGAAKEFNVPESSLRDRISGLVSMDPNKSGSPPLFTTEQEKHLADHYKFAAMNGYQYGRSEMVNIASEFAVYLGLRDRDNNLSNKWYSGFLNRWPELRLDKPRMSTGKRSFSGFSKPAVKSIENSEKQFGQIIAKYLFKEKPERIYHVDDKMLYVPVKRIPHVIGKEDEHQPDHRIISIVGCGNAVGNHIPPYFIFTGDKMKTVCLKEKTPGASGSKSEDGKLKGESFLAYLKEHFIKFLPERSSENPILLICDSSKTYITSEIGQWAEKENIIFLLVVSPEILDLSCFGRFDSVFQSECSKYVKGKSSRMITENNVCRLAGKSYINALSAENLHDVFRQGGLYPYKPGLKCYKVPTHDFHNTENNLITDQDHNTSNIAETQDEDNNCSAVTVQPIPNDHSGMCMHILTQDNEHGKNLQNITINDKEVGQNDEETLTNKDSLHESTEYYSFFSNIEKILLEKYKDGKVKTDKLSFMYMEIESAVINHLDQLNDSDESASKKSKDEN